MNYTEAVAEDGTACRLFGGGKPGEMVLLIHGLGLNQSMWQEQTGVLAERGPVVTYDLYGHGASPPPPEAPCLKVFADQAVRVLNHFDCESAVVMGFSLGGMIARRMAMSFPEAVAALAVLHSPHRRTQAEHDAIQQRVHQARGEGPGATVDAALDRWFTEEFRTIDPSVTSQVRRWVMANDAAVYPGIYQVLVDGVEELVDPSPAIGCPALVMTGDEDYGNHPAMSAAITNEIKGAELVVLKGLRHMAMMEAPAVFNGHLLKFLERISAPAP